MFKSLRDQRVVIIGASSGIGLATAKLLSKVGADLVLANRNIEKLNVIAKDLPGKTSTFRLDITVEEDVKAFFEAIGAFDHLVVPAASAFMGTLDDSPTESTRTLVDSKFWGQYFVVKYGTRQIAKNGSITTFSGTVSQKPIPRCFCIRCCRLSHRGSQSNLGAGVCAYSHQHDRAWNNRYAHMGGNAGEGRCRNAARAIR